MFSDSDDDTDFTPGFALDGAMALLQSHADARAAGAPEAKRPRLRAGSPLLSPKAEAVALPLKVEAAAPQLKAEAAALPLEAEVAALPPRASAKRKPENAQPRRALAAVVAAAPRAAAPAKAPRVLSDPEGRAAAVLLGGNGEIALLPAVRGLPRCAPPVAGKSTALLLTP